jgi:hypothetical protein
MAIRDLNDQSLFRLWENIREQVEAERGNRRKFMTARAIREYADSISEELVRRRLQHAPIDWAEHDQG